MRVPKPTLNGHQELANACGIFSLVVVGIPALGFLLFVPASRVNATWMLGLAITLGVLGVGYRCKITWEASGFRVSKGLFGLQFSTVLNRHDIKGLTLYGHYNDGSYSFSLWAQSETGRNFNLINEPLDQSALLEAKSIEIGNIIQVPVRKDESYYRLMKQATNAHRKLPKRAE